MKNTYFGSVIKSANRNADDGNNIKIGKIAVNLKKMSEIWQYKSISIRLKIRLYHATILPCLLYSSETCRSKVKLSKNFHAFYQRCLRQVLKVRNYVKCLEGRSLI